MTRLVFFAPGDPISKGSMSAFPMMRTCKRCATGKPCGLPICKGGKVMGATITDQHSPELKAWQGVIAVYARNARITAGIPIAPPGCAFQIGFVFLIDRPKAHYTSKGALSSEGEKHPIPTTKPDADKLARAGFDAMTGVIYTDDAQVPSVTIDKTWAPVPRRVGVVVTVERLERTPDRVIEALRLVGMRSPHEIQGSLV